MEAKNSKNNEIRKTAIISDRVDKDESSVGQRIAVRQADCLEWMKAQPDNSVDLVIGSPPYAEKARRYSGARRNLGTDEWVDWMLEVTKEAVRICSGMVIWIVNGSVRNRRYLPACEGLIWRWYKSGGWSERSCIWHKNSLPNRLDWFVNDWEFVLVFKKPESNSVFNWKSVAKPPKSRGIQHFVHRDGYGIYRKPKNVVPNKLARPRDIVRIPVGGNHMGHPLAHENEAPFPLRLAEYFIACCSRTDALVLDPFVGSGTSLHACLKLGRRAIGIDVRKSQVELAGRRVGDFEEADRLLRSMQNATREALGK